jgi:hypothetical protein
MVARLPAIRRCWPVTRAGQVFVFLRNNFNHQIVFLYHSGALALIQIIETCQEQACLRLGKLPSPLCTGQPVLSFVFVTPRVLLMPASSISSSVVRSRHGRVEFQSYSATPEFAAPQRLMGATLALSKSQACGHRALAA